MYIYGALGFFFAEAVAARRLWPARRRGRRGILGRARRQQEGPQLRATRLEPERAQGRALSGAALGGALGALVATDFCETYVVWIHPCAVVDS